MPDFHLAQINVANARAPMDDPQMAAFMAQLDEINALADRAPGFVWRLQSDSGNATDIIVTADPSFLINMSVWETAEALFDYVYKTAHTKVMAGRRDWFEQHDGPYQVLWWVPAGHIPTPQEGLERLEHLKQHGPTAHAFTFKARFPSPQDTNDAAD